MSEHQSIFVVVIVLKDKGQVIHMAFPDVEQAHRYAQDLEPTVRASREDFIRCDVVPVELRGAAGVP